MKRINYADEFDRLVNNSAHKIDVSEIYNALNTVSSTTVLKHLKAYARINPAVLERIVGFYPDSLTVIQLVESRIGLISSVNLWDANKVAKGIIDGITRPRHFEFLTSLWADFSSRYPANEIESCLPEFLELVYEDYAQFVRDNDNGLVSLAGALNEQLFLRALENAGLRKGIDFIKTGTDSDGDLIVVQSGGSKKRLSCEIKSYNARERLLRGLQDIQKPKIGLGFFRRADEFNPDRTTTLLGAEPSAIYMPLDTYLNLHPNSLNRLTASGNVLYRPLDVFVNDMKQFVSSGELGSMKSPFDF